MPSIYFAHEREVFERDGMLYAWREGTELIDGEEVFTETVRYRTVGDMSCTGGVRSQATHARGGRRRDRRDARSPSAARRAPTTASPRRRWRTARRPGTSRCASRSEARSRAGCVARGGRDDARPAALHHGGLGRRRQEHADRAAAVRLQAGLRGPARARRAGERAARRRGRARPGAADRRPARRARAGHHDRRRLPLLRDAQAALHHRRLPGPPAVHAQHGHRRLDGRPGGRPGRRAQGRDRAVQAPRVHQRAAGHPAHGRGGQQDGPRRATRRSASRSSSRSSPGSPRSSTRSGSGHGAWAATSPTSRSRR